MFLMQYFCLHGILPFSKSYPEIESTWPTAKCRGRKSFDTWYYIVTCATLCVSFSSKSKAVNVFPKHILKSKVRDQSIQASKKLFYHVLVKNYLCNVSWKLLIKIESTWRRETKEQVPQLIYCTVKGLSEANWEIKKAILKKFAISTGNICAGVYF